MEALSQRQRRGGELSDQSAFPSGHWPDPTTGSRNDGSVKDGDADRADNLHPQS